VDETMELFLKITRGRMLHQYLPKLTRALQQLAREELWTKATGSANSIGGIVLHCLEHLNRSTQTLQGKRPGAGIEDYFPDEGLEPGELVRLAEGGFRDWENELVRAWESGDSSFDMHKLYHLVEHVGYHLGQVIDRTQHLRSVSFQFCQNGFNEKNLRQLVEEEDWKSPGGPRRKP
jgi:hypothetical protein